ncbi:MAG: galactosyltransferase-related protein [Cyanobacteria bacterium]|nr:galactosyltransferase-related protein [Cyanobacteriota bacterium]
MNPVHARNHTAILAQGGGVFQSLPYFLASNNILFSKQRFLEIGGFDPSFSRAGAEDRDFCDRWRMAQWPLVWEPSACVIHRHSQTLWTFIRLHIRYGRGAFRYQALRQQRGSGTILEDFGFHRSLPRRVIQCFMTEHRVRKPLQTLIGLGIWQIANAMGFAIEALLARRAGNGWF